MTVQVTVIKDVSTPIEPITTITSTTLLSLTKIMTTIWEKKIK